MDILYAPSFRLETDTIHANCMVSYDIVNIEILNSLRGGGQNIAKSNNILYLPSTKTPQKYNEIVCDSLHYVKQIDSLSEASECDFLITDSSARLLAFTCAFLKPAIFFYPGYDNVSLSDDELDLLLPKIAYVAHSISELDSVVQTLSETFEDRRQNILEFLDGDLL